MTKICSMCKIEKPFDEFWKTKGNKDGLQSRCIDCKREEKKIYNQENSEEIAACKRMYRYKITNKQYNQLLLDQNNSCKTCKIEFNSTSKYTKPHIDHDHECCEGSMSCGKCVRGILCGSCNVLFGRVNDNIQTLQNMINYLKEYA